MDSLTHIVLGACIGELVAGKQAGKKILLIGAVANSLPDIDFVASFFLPLTADLLAHRGFTHSLLFIVLAAPLLAWLSGKLFRSSGVTFGRWAFFWSLQLFVHIFIDAFNAYGTAWFEPFSHYRVSFNSMFVADPLFTIWPLIAAIALATMGIAHRKRATIAMVALTCSALYLATGVLFKTGIDKQAHKSLQQNGITPQRYFSTPTPLNNLLWYVVAKSDSGFYIGYRSVLDKRDTTSFRYVCQNNYLLNNAANQTDINRLVRFSQGFYTAELRHDSLVFNDLRFGEIAGWTDSVPQCVFYYYPQLPGANELVVQRGRFAKWDGAALKAFIRRIRGI